MWYKHHDRVRIWLKHWQLDELAPFSSSVAANCALSIGGLTELGKISFRPKPDSKRWTTQWRLNWQSKGVYWTIWSIVGDVTSLAICFFSLHLLICKTFWMNIMFQLDSNSQHNVISKMWKEFKPSVLTVRLELHIHYSNSSGKVAPKTKTSCRTFGIVQQLPTSTSSCHSSNSHNFLWRQWSTLVRKLPMACYTSLSILSKVTI